MTELTIGQRYQTKRGTGVLLDLTPFQARVQPDDGDDPYWSLRGDLSPVPTEEETPALSVDELLDAIAALLEALRVTLATSAAPRPAVSADPPSHNPHVAEPHST